MSARLTSEIGRLRSVVVHSPGNELLAVTPSNRADFLYDDIIEADLAQREHRRFVSILQRFAEVHQVRDLLTEALRGTDARELILRETRDIVPSDALVRDIESFDAEAIASMLVEGREEARGPLAHALNADGYVLPPLHNLFFTRDSCMFAGEHVLIGSMRYATRWTEAIIMKVLARHHPVFANAGILYDGSNERRVNHTLEGGDLHPLRRDLAVIGFSERSSPAAIDELATLFFERTGITDIIVVVMPRASTAIHLDMIFTQIDRELCVVYPPYFIGPERFSVLHWKKGDATIHERKNMFVALRECGLPLEPVFCGGPKRTAQEREQWASGCNFVALRPGVIMSYQRNEATLRELERMGFRCVTGAGLLANEERIAEGERAVITFEGAELVRAGGGPRCMTMPIRREDPWD
jgi:arginine deiminase